MDVFSFGVLLWELITREPPQRGNLRGLDVPKDCPAEASSVLSECIMTLSICRCIFAGLLPTTALQPRQAIVCHCSV